ncbi:hypothetical protein [Pandoraea terrigena]|nr:hypothetical protein [Pandoraea terrigena]
MHEEHPNVTGLSVATATGEAQGLTEAEAATCLAQYGESVLAEHRVTVLERLAHCF